MVYSNYPNSIDAFKRKIDLIDLVQARDPNELQEAAENVEDTLGTNPQGTALSLVDRLSRCISDDGYTSQPTQLEINGGYPTAATIDSTGYFSTIAGILSDDEIQVIKDDVATNNLGIYSKVWNATAEDIGFKADMVGSGVLETGYLSYVNTGTPVASVLYKGVMLAGTVTEANGIYLSMAPNATTVYGSRIVLSGAGITNEYGYYTSIAGTSTNARGADLNVSATTTNTRGLNVGVTNATSYGIGANVDITASGAATTTGVNVTTTGGTGQNRGISSSLVSAGTSTNYAMQAIVTGTCDQNTGLSISNSSTTSVCAYGININVSGMAAVDKIGIVSQMSGATATSCTAFDARATAAIAGTNYGFKATVGNASTFNYGVYINQQGSVNSRGIQVTNTSTNADTKAICAIGSGVVATAYGFYSDMTNATIAYDLYCNQNTSFVKFPYVTSAPTAAVDNGTMVLGYVSGGAMLYWRANSVWQSIDVRDITYEKWAHSMLLGGMI